MGIDRDCASGGAVGAYCERLRCDPHERTIHCGTGYLHVVANLLALPGLRYSATRGTGKIWAFHSLSHF